MLSLKTNIILLLLLLTSIITNPSLASQSPFTVKSKLITPDAPNLKWSSTTQDLDNLRIIMVGQSVATNNQSEIWEFSLQDYTWRFLTYLDKELNIVTQDLFYNSINNQVVIIASEINTFDLKTYVLTEDDEISQIEILPSNTSRLWNEYLFIEKYNYLFTFGGLDESFMVDDSTFIFDFENNKWIQVETSTKPSKRGYQSMVYDPINDQIILFGGIVSEGNIQNGVYIDLGDTWAFDFDTLSWTEKTANLSPVSRLQSGMVYDSLNNLVLLFGGSSARDSSLYFDDLWSLDTRTYQWNLVDKDFGVRKMGLPNLEYVGSSNSIILTGGYAVAPSLRFYDDTWELSLVLSPNSDLTINFGDINMPLVLLVIGGSLGVIAIIVYNKKYQ